MRRAERIRTSHHESGAIGEESLAGFDRLSEVVGTRAMEDRIRSALVTAATGRDQAAYSLVLEYVFDAIEQGIVDALGPFVADGEDSEILTYFIEKKFSPSENEPSRKFLCKVAEEANSVRAYVRKSARRFAQTERRSVHEGATAVEQATLERYAGPRIGEEAQEREDQYQEANEKLASVLKDLGDEDRILLYLCQRVPLDDSQIEFLARRREVKPLLVQAELERRYGQEAEDSERKRRDLQGRMSNFAKVLEDIGDYERLLMSLRTELVGEASSLSQEQIEAFGRGFSTRKNAGPLEQRGYYRALLARRERYARLVLDAKHGLNESLQPGYDEIALIMGEATSTSPKSELKKVISRLTQRRKRLMKRLSAGSNSKAP